jgi:predicted MFS family arabinose efflux permease
MLSSVNKLYLYNLLTAASLTVVAEFIFVDQLLLRIHTGVAMIGVLKALIFFLPVVSYQLVVPLLNRLRAEIPLCAFCYVLRVLLPAAIPAAALLGAGDSMLKWMSIAILPAAMMLAAFANNALMIVYRRQLPPKTFNRCSGIMQMCFNLPSFVLGIPVSLGFKFAAGLDDRSFFLTYLASMLGCALFQLPAAAVLLSLGRERNSGENVAATVSWWDQLRPYRDQEYRRMLEITLLHSLVGGAGLAYIGVFCMKIMDIPVSGAFFVRVATACLGLLLVPYAGHLADRVGYRRMYLWGGALMSLGLALLAAFPYVWMLPFCALLFWDGISSPVGGALYMCEQAAASKLAPEQGTAGYIAAFSVARNAGMAAGAFVSGTLFGALSRAGVSKATGMRFVFAACLLPLALLMAVAGGRKER